MSSIHPSSSPSSTSSSAECGKLEDVQVQASISKEPHLRVSRQGEPRKTPSESESESESTGSTLLPDIPFEILCEIVPYLVASNTLADLFHLSQTCKDLHASLWLTSSDIWRVVWNCLYDELEQGQQQQNEHKTRVPKTTALTTITSEQGKEPKGSKSGRKKRERDNSIISKSSNSNINNDNIHNSSDHAGDNRAIIENKTNKYKAGLRHRLQVFRDLEGIGQALHADAVPWDTIAYGYTNGLMGLPENQKRYSSGEIASAVWNMICIAEEHVWAYAVYLLYRYEDQEKSSVEEICPMFGKPTTLCKFYHALAQISAVDPYVLEAIYRDRYESFRYLRGSVFRREDGCSFGRLAIEQIPRLWFPWSISQVVYTVLFCGPSILQYQDRLRLGGIGTSLNLSSEIVNINNNNNISNNDTDTDNESNHTDNSATTTSSAYSMTLAGPLVTSRRTGSDWAPSWFNFGTAAHLIRPLPLTVPHSTKNALPFSHPLCSTRLAGHWTGYYAYSDEESSDLAALQRTTRPEYACRGIALDTRMKIVIVDWTVSSCAATLTSPSVRRDQEKKKKKRDDDDAADQGGGDEPLYLSSALDVQAFLMIDRYFMPFRQGASRRHLIDDDDDEDDYWPSEEGDMDGEGDNINDDDYDDELDSLDDITDENQWGYQRIFSGRGHDIFGEFGVRGIISERTGLVRMVKNYLRQLGETVDPDGPTPFEAAAALALEGSYGQDAVVGEEAEEEERRRAYLEFGPHRGQLTYRLNSESSVWYYRGQLSPRGQRDEQENKDSARCGNGRAIQGLWFTEVDSGPIWIYRTDGVRGGD
ncbi:hypothetical protein BG004_000729 [Podila humilis]|nr:hypothetical protein BG004_000729 [Podila humilis]